MSKRKRELQDGNDSNDGSDDRPSEKLRSQDRLRGRFGKSVKDLTKALKLARGFERQKLGRRQKQATHEPHTLLRLREEVIVLKQLDLEKTAKDYLLKYLSRIKRIREHPDFVVILGSEPNFEAVKPGAETNVLGRLFKTALVKDTVDKIVDSMYKNMGLQQGGLVSKEKKFDASNSSRSMKEALSKDLSIGQEDLSEENDGSDVRGAQNGRMALSDEEDSFASFGSESVIRSASPSPLLERESATTFLPSLGVAGYYSGSESDASDIGPAEPEARKNRRGQRARQQLAELKYGKNAKHLQNLQSDKNRKSDWDARRGAVDSSNREHARGGSLRQENRRSKLQEGPRRSDELSIRKERPKTQEDAGPIHPSWQAAKQRKQQSSGSAAFTGRKVTFD